MKKIILEYFKNTNSFSVHIDTYDTEDSTEFSRHSCGFVPGELNKIQSYVDEHTGLKLDDEAIKVINDKWPDHIINSLN
jgi:hypothetical protein